MRTRAYLFIVPVGLVALAAAGFGGGDQSDAPTSFDRSVTLEGLILPSRRVELGMRVPGILTSRPIREGQFVEAGALIAELDRGREKAVVEFGELRATSNLGVRAAQADESFRLYELERQRALSNDKATSSWELRAAEISYALALVQTEKTHFDQILLQAQLVRDRVLLNERTMTAPFAGWILRTLKDEGEPVDEFEPIAILVQLDPLWIDLNVSAEYFGRLSHSDTAAVILGSNRKQAKLITVDPLVDPGSSTFLVRVEVDNEGQSLVAGMMATVELSIDPDATATVWTDPTVDATRTASQTGRRRISSQDHDNVKPAMRVSFPSSGDRPGSRSPSDSKPVKRRTKLKPAYDDFDWVEERGDQSSPPQ